MNFAVEKRPFTFLKRSFLCFAINDEFKFWECLLVRFKFSMEKSQTKIEGNDGLASVWVDVFRPVLMLPLMFLPSEIAAEKTEKHGESMADFTVSL